MTSDFFDKIHQFLKDWIELKRSFKLFKRHIGGSEDAVYLIENQLFWTKKGFEKIGSFYRRKLLHKYGIMVGDKCKIGKNLHLPHPNGIVLGEHVEIGNGCTIYQQVTVGAKSRKGPLNENAYPKIGNNVVLYAGAKVIGGICLGNRTVFGANTVIHKSTEPKTVWRGNPAVEIGKYNEKVVNNKL